MTDQAHSKAKCSNRSKSRPALVPPLSPSRFHGPMNLARLFPLVALCAKLRLSRSAQQGLPHGGACARCPQLVFSLLTGLAVFASARRGPEVDRKRRDSIIPGPARAGQDFDARNTGKADVNGNLGTG